MGGVTAAAPTAFNIRHQLAIALGAPPRCAPSHEEAGGTFTFHGQQVRVRERVRVESQDPSLMAALAKLAVLEHTIMLNKCALDVLVRKTSGLS